MVRVVSGVQISYYLLNDLSQVTVVCGDTSPAQATSPPPRTSPSGSSGPATPDPQYPPMLC